MASKFQSNLVKILLTFFWGINLLVAIIWELIKKLTKSKSQEQQEILTSDEYKEYNTRFFISVSIAVLMLIFLGAFYKQIWFIFICIMVVIQVLSLGIITMNSSNFYYISANPTKILDELSLIIIYSIVDSLIYAFYIVLNVTIFKYSSDNLKTIALIIAIIGFMFSGFFILFYRYKKRVLRLELTKIMHIHDYLNFSSENISLLNKNIQNLKEIIFFAKTKNFEKLTNIVLKNMKKKYTILIKLYSDDHKKDEITKLKEEYKDFRKKLKVK
jgi:hypothetical protein